MYQQLKRASMALTLSSVCFLAFAQKTIQGTVKDANGDPMIGVTITDQNGKACLLYTSPSPRDRQKSRMPSSA